VANNPVRARLAHKRTFVATADHLEGAFHQDLLGLVGRQERATVANLSGNRGRRIRSALRAANEQPPPQPDQQPPPTPQAGNIFDLAAWTAKTADVAAPHIRNAAQAGIDRTAAQLGTTSSLDGVEQILADRTNRLAGQVTQTTFDQIQQALADGVQQGESIRQLADRIRHVFDTTRTRAQTIARTEVPSAMNQASLAYAQSLPAGTVAHKEWLCVAAGTRVASAKPVEVVERRRMAGYMTRLRTRGGRVLAVTPNHPVLTDQGWTPAHRLNVGDKLVCQVRPDPVRVDGGVPSRLVQRRHPDVHDAPPTVDEVFRAASLACADGRMVTVVPDLYSDPVHCEVEVVPIDGDLSAHLQAPFGKHPGDVVLELTDEQLARFVMEGPLMKELIGPLADPERLLGCGALGVTPKLKVGVLSGHQESGLTVTTDGDASLSELPLNRIGATTDTSTDGQEGLSSLVALDELVDVDTVWEPGRHQVYDLVTDQGWFVANDIIVHNSVHDTRTRMSHRVADGQRQPVFMPFGVGGTLMMHPGDPEAPPAETVNCRCTMLMHPGSPLTALGGGQ
jgi:uncharacterized protein YoaH (UPF0181 family)